MPTKIDSLDEFDRALLREAQSDARRTNAELADCVNLSESAVRRRLTRLRNSGLIAREVAILDRDRRGFIVIVGVRCSEESEASYKRLKNRWAACEEIGQVYNVSGESDFILVGHFADMPAYKAWIADYVTGDPDVERCDTSFAFETVKFETAIPV